MGKHGLVAFAEGISRTLRSLCNAFHAACGLRAILMQLLVTFLFQLARSRLSFRLKLIGDFFLAGDVGFVCLSHNGAPLASGYKCGIGWLSNLLPSQPL